MLDIYQRPVESVRPWPTISADLWTTPAWVEKGQYLIAIFDNSECSRFITLKDSPPVFISLRRSVDGMGDEIALGIPDDTPGEAAAQLAAAQIENALAAVESMPPEKRARIVSAFGLKNAGSPGAGPRALRAHVGPAGKILVSIFYEDLRDDFLLSQLRPAISFCSQSENVAVSAVPELYAADLFLAAAAVLKGIGTKERKHICADFGIDMQTFLREK